MGKFDPNANREIKIEEAGEYLAELIDVQMWRAKSGNEGLKFTFEVLVGPRTGAQITDTFWLSDAAIKRFGTFTCLFHTETFDLEDAAEVWQVFAGRRLMLRVASVVKEDGREFFEVKKYAMPTKALLMQVAAVARLAAAFPREDMMELKSREPRPTDTPNRNTEYGGGDDGTHQAAGAAGAGRGRRRGTLDDDVPF
jgi:hypothetical protein